MNGCRCPVCYGGGEPARHLRRDDDRHQARAAATAKGSFIPLSCAGTAATAQRLTVLMARESDTPPAAIALGGTSLLTTLRDNVIVAQVGIAGGEAERKPLLAAELAIAENLLVCCTAWPHPPRPHPRSRRPKPNAYSGRPTRTDAHELNTSHLAAHALSIGPPFTNVDGAVHRASRTDSPRRVNARLSAQALDLRPWVHGKAKSISGHVLCHELLFGGTCGATPVPFERPFAQETSHRHADGRSTDQKVS